ncbi:MAG: DUF1476 domain-containing protein [Alphaproteobacteria bacterium]|nr:MAG: DUF1476 domain-containing protein [Alphaproteobacteria bacterium]
MTTFEEREQGFERKFAHDEELRFKAMVRRDKLIGLWAAGEMGIAGADAEAYAKEVIKADFEKVGDDDVVEKLRRDFAAKKIDMSEHRIRRQLAHFMDVAREQIRNELTPPEEA